MRSIWKPAIGSCHGSGGSLTTSFVPDVGGTYVVRVDVSDGLVSASDSVQVQAQTVTAYVQSLLSQMSGSIASLPNAAFAATGHRSAMLNALADLSAAVVAGDTALALKKVDQLSQRTDGCTYSGTPDASGSGSDWIIDCGVQSQLLTSLNQVRYRLTPGS